jgi:Uncharacterized protein conserved in bacteria (DUF2314)
MKPGRMFLLIGLLLGCSIGGVSQEPEKLAPLATNAPKDQPKQITSEALKKFEEAIKPYVEKARKTYPDAKKRFLAGLPPKYVFFVTTRLHDSSGKFEQVFIYVKEIKDGTITGIISSDVETVAGYKLRDTYSFPESELMDWTITKPDGTEEGNFVGKFLDTYHPD